MTTPRKRKPGRRRPTKQNTRLNGLLSNGNLKAAGRFSLKTAIYVVIGLFTILTLFESRSEKLEASAQNFIEETVKPMLEKQSEATEELLDKQAETLKKVGDNADANTQGIYTMQETVNLQYEYMRKDLDRHEEAIDKLEDKVK